MRATQHFECCVRQATRPGQHANGARSEQAGHQGRARGGWLQRAAPCAAAAASCLCLVCVWWWLAEVDHAQEADPLKIVKCSPSVSIFGSYQFKNLESKLEVGTWNQLQPSSSSTNSKKNSQTASVSCHQPHKLRAQNHYQKVPR